MQACRKILDANGLSYVSIEKILARSSNHYDSRANIIRLSNNVYLSTSIYAIGWLYTRRAMLSNMQKDIL